MEERILISQIYVFLKNKLLKIIIVSFLIALIISIASTFLYKEELVYKTSSRYVISYSDEEENSDKEDYAVYIEVIDSIIHSDYLYEKVTGDIGSELSKADYDVIVTASFSGGGRIVDVSSYHIVPELSEALNESICKNFNEACKEYFNCSAELLSKDGITSISNDSNEIISPITSVLGHNYVDRDIKDIVIDAVKYGVLSFVAVSVLLTVLYSILYVFKFGRFSK